jgi:uncharacterized protein
MILMDYRNKRRLKVYGHVKMLETAEDPTLATRLEMPAYRARVERSYLISVEAFDWNCPQHITPRLTEIEVAAIVEPLQKRIRDLEQLKNQIR